MARRLRTALVLGLLALGMGCASTPPKPTNVDVDPDQDTPVAHPASVGVPAAAAEAAAPLARPPTQGRTRTYAFPVATLPGFEMLPDGGSRIFVEVTRKVDVEERRTARVLTYVLKGARIVYRNNENPLVTIHFNTPVTQARLVPSGRDLLLSVDLRADTAVTWKMIAGDSAGSATLELDFPKGSFLPIDGSIPEMPPPPPRAARTWRGRGRGAPPPVAAGPETPPPGGAPADGSGGAAVPGN